MYFLFKKKTKESLINIGSGVEKSINDYARFIMKYLQLELKIVNQNNKLEGTPRKLLIVAWLKNMDGRQMFL